MGLYCFLSFVVTLLAVTQAVPLPPSPHDSANTLYEGVDVLRHLSVPLNVSISFQRVISRDNCMCSTLVQYEITDEAEPWLHEAKFFCHQFQLRLSSWNFRSALASFNLNPNRTRWIQEQLAYMQDSPLRDFICRYYIRNGRDCSEIFVN